MLLLGFSETFSAGWHCGCRNDSHPSPCPPPGFLPSTPLLLTFAARHREGNSKDHHTNHPSSSCSLLQPLPLPPLPLPRLGSWPT